MEKIIYLDNAATTKPFAEIEKIYTDCVKDFYNPSAVYSLGVSVRRRIDDARSEICKCLHAEHGNIIFTASATEADNLALSLFKPRANNALAVFIGEHPAVYQKAKAFETAGAKVIYLPANSDGAVDEISKHIDSTTGFVSVMHVSNETGSINNLSLVVKAVKKINPRAIVHSDGVQAFGKIPVNLRELGVDMYTISAHKIYGPKGIGALWVKNGINVNPLIFGGGQEKAIRSGTENVAGILSLAYCAQKVTSDLDKNFNKVSGYRKELISQLEQNKVEFEVNGNGSPYILNLTFNGIRGEVLLHSLEKYGIYISTGSACSSKKPDNRMLKAMGKTDKQIQGTIRISFSPYEEYDIKNIAKIIAQEVKDLQFKIKGK